MMNVTCGFTIPITKYGLPPTVDNIIKVMGEISEAGFDTMEMEIVAGEEIIFTAASYDRFGNDTDAEIVWQRRVKPQLFL